MDELVAAKQDDEAALLQKFRDLLNEKKVKIREQQKVITEISANGVPAEEYTGEVEDLPTAKAAKKAPKRKAKAVENETPDEDVDMAAAVKEEPEDSDGGGTTEATASVASDDDDDDEDEDMDRPQGQPAREPAPPKKQGQPPPPRALPFQKKPVAANDSDSDDEL